MTPESRTLHHILFAVIIDGIQRSRTDADLAAQAEAAARALRAGLAAFIAPNEAAGGDCANATLDVTRHYGGAADGSLAKSGGATGFRAEAVAGEINPTGSAVLNGSNGHLIAGMQRP